MAPKRGECQKPRPTGPQFLLFIINSVAESPNNFASDAPTVAGSSPC